MTKEQAIQILRANVMVACDTSDKVGYGTPLNKAIEQALEMAIKALEQPTSDDCVSRQAVIDAVENTIAKYILTFIGQYEKIPLELAKAIKDVPSVTPTFPKGATNYDVLKAVFDNISAFRIKDTMEFEKGFEHWFSKPYKRGNENG